ncbi:glycosyl transferase [Paenibacillus antibioticophila]|uniref:Glycosyl transferase n=1 Tax=Paenibacillus antibioticophila TaxID=1274374 RepID=A0A919XLE9_9BACL|nr:glycosyltransferase family 2 protein [Paenibacillus antibioticophila]GIO35151.1 glycosyl transferase [Paenibacillus antibioticophila]
MDLSVIIVSYNTRLLTLGCLQSVFASETEYAYEVILVDNASGDGSAAAIKEHFPQVSIIENKDNVGFAKANNQAMTVAGGRYVLMLNSDTVVQPDTLQKMIAYMDVHPHTGAAGCKVILPNGSLDKACKRGFPTPSAAFYYLFGLSRLFPVSPRFNRYQLGHLDPDLTHAVDCLVGAFMVVRQETIWQVGVLDEAFFMYGEDVDWCYRIKQAGWGIDYYPATCIVHVKGASSRRKPLKIIYEFHRAMWLFHRKHYKQRYSWFVNFVVFSGIAMRFAVSLAANKLRLRRPERNLAGTAPSVTVDRGQGGGA